MDDYLCKPFVREELVTVLKRWLSAFERTRDDEAANEPDIDMAPGGETRPAAPAAVISDNLPVTLDMAVLEASRRMERNGSPGLMARLADLYQGNTATLLPTIARRGEAREREGLRTVAHTQSPAAPMWGRCGYRNLCKELETMARAGQCRTRWRMWWPSSRIRHGSGCVAGATGAKREDDNFRETNR